VSTIRGGMFDSKQVLLQTRPLFWCAELICCFNIGLKYVAASFADGLKLMDFFSYGSSRSKDGFLMLWQLLWMNRSTVFQLSNCWKTKPRRADYLSDDNLGWSGHPGALGPSCGAPSFVRSLGTVFGFLMILMLYHVCVEGCKLFWGECLIVFWVLIGYVLNLVASCRKFCRLNWSYLA